MSRFSFEVLGEQTGNEVDDNVDVQIRLEDGRLYTATFFTLQNLQTLFERNKQSGECAAGTYFWAADMICVHVITPEVIQKTIRALLDDGELEASCSEVEPAS